MATRNFKPCVELKPRDFKRNPIWGFDLSRAESDPEADETWVAPQALRRVPKYSDGLFISAVLTLADGKKAVGAFMFRFVTGRVLPEAIALLEPTYQPLGFDGEKVLKTFMVDLKRTNPKAAKWFPITYSAHCKIGSKEFVFSGKVR